MKNMTKKIWGGKIAPRWWVREAPRYPVTRWVTGAKNFFPSAQINFMNSCKKTRRNILRFSGYLAKTARGGKIAPPPPGIGLTTGAIQSGISPVLLATIYWK